jgi:hypothetical protein
MSNHEITKEETFIGEWFLPSDDFKSARKIAGTMTWTTRRARLELHDCFTALQGHIYGDETSTYPVVHGITLNSKLITILDVSGFGSSFSFGHGGIRQTEKLRSSLVVIGGHVTGDTSYTEMQVRIPGLERWLNRGGIELTMARQTNNKPNVAIYKVENLPPEEFPIKTIAASVDFSVNRSFKNLIGQNVNVTSYGLVTIKPSEPQKLDWYFEQVGKVCTLLGFLSGTPMGPDRVVVKHEAANHSLDVLVSLRQDKLCAIEDGHEFFLLRSDLGADFAEVLGKWFEVYDSIEMPCQLAQSVLATDDLWLHVEFLSLMQALEGFHRATSSGFYLTAEDYAPIKDAILASFPKCLEKSHRQSLKSRIEYGNEISLGKRLSDLASRLDDDLRRRLFGPDGKVPRSWIDTRNYYTHWDEASRDNVLDGAPMHHAGVRLKLLLRVLYLNLLGIPSEAIAKALSGANRESQYLIQLNNSEIRKVHPGAKVQPLLSIHMKEATAPDARAELRELEVGNENDDCQ